MVLNVSNYIGSAVLYLKAVLKAGITDPILSSRTTTGDKRTKFIMTSYPKRATEYPHITIKFVGQNPFQNSGQRDESKFINISLEVRMWGRDMKEKDNLTSQVVNVLRKNQITVTEGSIAFGLVDFDIESIVPVDEDGSDGIKSNVATVNYNLELHGD